ncbi:MAG: TonB-dependent receptor, partial [Pseudomonadota bacterium]
SVQDTQTSVSVVTDTVIDNQAIFELSDIFLRTANVTQTAGAFSFSIRGINSGGVGGAGTGRTSNVYVDGAPASLNGLSSAFNLWDIDQVEILRGPQSTTQGRNALAGAVVIQSADPEYDFGAKARALFGNNETYQFSGMLTGPIIDDQVAFRLSVDYREQDFETINAVVGTPEGASDALTARGKLLFEPNAIPDLRVETSVSYIDFFTSGDGSGVILDPNRTITSRSDLLPFDRENFDFRGGVIDNENLRFLADVTYRFTENWSAQVVGTYDDTERLITNIGGPDLREEETYTIDARAIFDYDRITGWIGGYYFKDDLFSATEQDFDVSSFGGVIDPAGTLVRFVQNRSAETENYAIYGDVLFALTDRISLNFGARYDWEDVVDTGFSSQLSADADPCFVSVPFVGTGPCALLFAAFGSTEPVGGTSFEAFLPRGGAIYNVDDDKSISFMVQRGYRAGGFFVLNGQVEQFDAEFITNYELAWRSVLFDNRLTFNANAFFATWSDQQLNIPEPGLLDNRVVNAGASELYGLEIDASFQVTPAFEIYGNLGLVETEFTDFPFAVDENGEPLGLVDVDLNPIPGLVGNPFANLAGNEFPSAPGLTGTLGASYDSESGLFGSANVSYRSNQFSDVTNLPINQTGDYTLVNARVGYQTDNWRISVFVDNLFDEEFFRSLLLDEVNRNPESGGNATLGQAGTRRNAHSQPRHFGVEIEAAF